jgi:hypothetical protein
MKSVNKLLVLVMLFTLAFAGNAFAAESDYSYVDNGDGTATITGYSGTDTNLVIPSTVDGLTVTSIGADAFENKGISEVTIPNTVQTIGSGAFKSNSLTSIIIPDSVITIGDRAFAKNSLTSVTIPENVVNIEALAFADNQITSATFLSVSTVLPNPPADDIFLNNVTVPSYLTIFGYDGSTAETFATSNGYTFSSLGPAPAPEPVSKDVTVTGNVYATVLDFSVPLEVTFVIDPNQSNPQDRFISPVLTVQNLTNAPVKLSIASFEMKQESIDKGFQSVAPSLYSDDVWSKLNKADSKKLAVGIKANNNWQQLDNANALYANQFSDEMIGTITANGSADFVFEAKHGNAFDKAETIKYTVSFVIELD